MSTSKKTDTMAPAAEALASSIKFGANFLPRWIDRILDPDAFDSAIQAWADRIRHGGVKSHLRAGAALRSPSLIGQPHGLLTPNYFTLKVSDVPETGIELIGFFRNLLVSPDRAETDSVDAAVNLATKNLASSDGVVTLEDHVDALLQLREETSKAHFHAAVLGDVVRGERLYAETDRALKHKFTRALTRGAIIWSGGHTHRVAAHGHKTTSDQMIPWFLKPFATGKSANQLMRVHKKVATAISRVFDAADNAKDHGRETVSIGGRLSYPLIAGKLMTRALEDTLSNDDRNRVLKTREPIRNYAKSHADYAEAFLADPSRTDQQSIYEAKFGLSPLAALYVAAYRHAQLEAVMMQVLEKPQKCALLFNTWPIPFPRLLSKQDKILDKKANRRALYLLAGLRPTVLFDAHADAYAPAEIIAAEDSVAAARRFLFKVGHGEPLSDQEQHAVFLYDTQYCNRNAEE